MATGTMMLKLVLDNGEEIDIDIDINELFAELATRGEPIVAPAGVFFPMLDFIGPIDGETIN